MSKPLEQLSIIAAQTAAERALAEMEQTCGLEATAAMAKGFTIAAVAWLEKSAGPLDAYTHVTRLADDIAERMSGIPGTAP